MIGFLSQSAHTQEMRAVPPILITAVAGCVYSAKTAITITFYNSIDVLQGPKMVFLLVELALFCSSFALSKKRKNVNES